MVTLFSGSRLCTIRRLPSFFSTQNHLDLYDEFEGSYTPASIFLLISAVISLYSPGGIGKFFSTQGVCGTTGILTGGNISRRNQPHSGSVHAKPSFCLHIKSSIKSSSASCKNDEWSECNLSRLSCVYLPVGLYFGGFGFSSGISSRGSPMRFLIILNSWGNVDGCARTFKATGLYFFLVFRNTSNICSSSKWTVGVLFLILCMTVDAGRQINSGPVRNLEGTTVSSHAHKYAFLKFSSEESTNRVYAVASTLMVF